MYHSKGAFTHDDVYSMPIYLRLFYNKKLHETLTKEKEEYDKASKGKGRSSGTPNIPSFAQNAGKK